MRYFRYSVDHAIERLREKACTSLAAAEKRPVRSALLLAQALPDSICSELKTRTLHAGLGHAQGDTPEPGLLRFHQELKDLYADSPFSAGIREDEPLPAFLDVIANAHSFATLEFLALSYYQLYHARRPLDSEVALSVLRRLMGKFEVFGRIFSAYDAQFRRASERYDDLTLYALMALVLLGVYRQTRNLTFLNTALKLNDVIVTAVETIDGPVLTWAALSALAHGRTCLEELYDSEGFRLPVGQ